MKSGTLKLLLRSLKYLKPYWKLQLLCLFIATILAALSLVQPWINKLLIDDVLIAGDIAGLKLVCLFFAGAYLFQAGFGVLQSYLYTKIGGEAILDLRRDLYNHLQTLSIPFFHRNRTGSLISSFISDIEMMQGLYTSILIRVITDILMFSALLAVMFLISPQLTWISIVSLPCYGILIKKIGKPIRQASEQVQEKRARATGKLQEKISGIREIKAFACEQPHSISMSSSFRDLFDSSIRLTLTGALSSISGVISVICFILIIWFGGKQVIAGAMQLGVFIAFMGYMGRLYGPVNTFVNINNSIQISMGAAKRVFRILDKEPNIIQHPDSIRLSSIEGLIEFKKVFFSYNSDEAYALRNVSLRVDPGSTVALVGSSGAGKTTLAMLLMRFYDPDSGEILIDGNNLRNIDLETYRKQIGVVFQDPFLFNASITENIIQGNPDADLEAVKDATDAANATDFISELPDGFETVIGERGVTLSGGQQQRLAIARAILKNPRIVIFDEATSALDTKSEKLVQNAMDHLLKDRTSIIIAHRLSTVKSADCLAVLERGSIVELGNYGNLMKSKSRFWEFHRND